MTITREVVKLRLGQALKECEQHRFHLHSAWKEATHFGALQKSSTEKLDNGQIRTLDQLLFRFGKLQDAIGLRLLPSILRLLAEWQDSEPFIDKLNRAERIGILPSAEQWQVLRELRNQISHEYPDQPEVMVENLVGLLEQVPILAGIHLQMVRFTESCFGTGLEKQDTVTDQFTGRQ